MAHGRRQTVRGMRSRSRDGPSLLGIAAACVACCIGLILALLGAVGLAGLAATLFVGAAGLLITGAAVVAVLMVRRRRATCAPDRDQPVAVAAPTAKNPR